MVVIVIIKISRCVQQVKYNKTHYETSLWRDSDMYNYRYLNITHKQTELRKVSVCHNDPNVNKEIEGY